MSKSFLSDSDRAILAKAKDGQTLTADERKAMLAMLDRARQLIPIMKWYMMTFAA